jgi:hypothetical protein
MERKTGALVLFAVVACATARHTEQVTELVAASDSENMTPRETCSLLTMRGAGLGLERHADFDTVRAHYCRAAEHIAQVQPQPDVAQAKSTNPLVLARLAANLNLRRADADAAARRFVDVLQTASRDELEEVTEKMEEWPDKYWPEIEVIGRNRSPQSSFTQHRLWQRARDRLRELEAAERTNAQRKGEASPAMVTARASEVSRAETGAVAQPLRTGGDQPAVDAAANRPRPSDEGENRPPSTANELTDAWLFLQSVNRDLFQQARLGQPLWARLCPAAVDQLHELVDRSVAPDEKTRLKTLLRKAESCTKAVAALGKDAMAAAVVCEQTYYGLQKYADAPSGSEAAKKATTFERQQQTCVARASDIKRRISKLEPVVAEVREMIATGYR